MERVNVRLYVSAICRDGDVSGSLMTTCPGVPQAGAVFLFDDDAGEAPHHVHPGGVRYDLARDLVIVRCAPVMAFADKTMEEAKRWYARRRITVTEAARA